MKEKQKTKEIFGKEIWLKILKYEDKRKADNLWKRKQWIFKNTKSFQKLNKFTPNILSKEMIWASEIGTFFLNSEKIWKPDRFLEKI